MDIIQLNNQIEEFVNKNNFSHDALALKQEHAIQKSEEWQRVLDSFAEQGRVLRIGIIGRVKAGKAPCSMPCFSMVTTFCPKPPHR